MELFPYQKIGATWLVTKKHAILGDQMGLGKSAQVIKAADQLQAKKILVVGPAVARITWLREFEKLSSVPRKIRVLKKIHELPNDQDEVVIVSFDYMAKNYPKFKTFNADLLVVDEAHYLKNHDAIRTRAILSKVGVIRYAKRAWFLTGTPMPNHPGELWPIMRTLGAIDLEYDAFVRRYCTSYIFNGQRIISGTRMQALPELKESLDTIMLRRLTKDVLPELPEVRIREVNFEAKLENLTPELKAQWDNLEAFFKNLPKDLTPTQQLDMLSGVAQSISTLRRYCALAKVKPVCDLISTELENNSYEKIIVFGHHTEGLENVTSTLKRFGAVQVTGSVSGEARQAAIDAFQNDTKCRVFVGNIQAAGTNITLTKASEVMFLEQSFVPGDNQKAIARAARIGQKNSVNVRIASLADTVDEKVQEILTRKLSEISELLGG